MVDRGGLENRCGPLDHRGFESHPLRLLYLHKPPLVIVYLLIYNFLWVRIPPPKGVLRDPLRLLLKSKTVAFPVGSHVASGYCQVRIPPPKGVLRDPLRLPLKVKQLGLSHK